MMVMLMMLYDNELQYYPAQKSMEVNVNASVFRLAYFCVLGMCFFIMTIWTTIKCFYMYLFGRGCLVVKRLVTAYSPLQVREVM
jgi:hypothetical protein